MAAPPARVVAPPPAGDPLPYGWRIGLSFESSANLFFRDLAEDVRDAAAARGDAYCQFAITARAL